MKKLFFFIFFIFLFSFNVFAFGIGVSPSNLLFDNIYLNQTYEKDVILINPNDFGIEYSFRELPEVKVNPTKGFLSPNSKKKEVLIFSFIDYLDEKAYLIVESKKINNRGDSFGVLPSIGVKITNKQNSQDSTQEKSNIEPRNLGDELEDVKIIKIPRKERITDSVSKPFSFSPKTEVIFLIVIIIVLGLCLLYIFLKEKIEIKINKQ